MSVTGHGAKTGHVRHADDFYATPAWCTRAILEVLGRTMRSTFCDTDAVMDPCCGDGATDARSSRSSTSKERHDRQSRWSYRSKWGPAVTPYWQSRDGRIVLYLGDCREVMATLADKSVDHVITDPPYSEHTHAKNRPPTRNPHRARRAVWCVMSEINHVSSVKDAQEGGCP